MKRLSLLAVVAMLVSAVLPSAASAAGPTTAFVAADASWVSSGVTATAGDDLSIRAHGQAITGPLATFPGARSGPDGQATICPDPGGPNDLCNLNGEPYGALVGMIDGTVFVIGSSYAGTAPASGEIMLAINDNLGYHADNRGGFAVQIRN